MSKNWFTHHNMALYRNVGCATGVSLIGKEEDRIATPDRLPDYLVEIHLFTNDNEAASFVAGVNLAGRGNDIAVDFSPGYGQFCNRGVVVARFSEERLHGNSIADCVEVIEHERVNYEMQSIAETLRRKDERTKARDEVAEQTRGPILERLKEHGWKVDRHGEDWAHIGSLEREDSGATLSWKGTGHFTVEMGFYGLFEAPESILGQIEEELARRGYSMSSVDRETEHTVTSLDAAIDYLDEMVKLHDDMETFKKDAYRDEFRRNFKMTPSRKTFLKAVMTDGLHLYERRRHTRAMAGSLDIGQTELNGLMYAGWIEQGNKGYIVTEAALSAMGIEGSAGLKR